MKEQILKCVELHYLAKKETAKVNINIYLSSVTGIGEHSKVVEEVILLMEEYDKYKSILDTLESDFLKIND
jgi:hypothetical protein